MRRTPLLSLLAACLLASSSSCSPRRGAERLVLGRAVWLTSDVAYDTGASRALDVYRLHRRRLPSPVIVFLYGGRWKYGTKRDYLLLANALARRGWVVVVPDYRHYPAALFPAWVEDGAHAVRWTRDNIARYSGDTTRIYVVGHSAGAHTVTLLALDEHYLRDAGVPDGAVRGFVSLAGPVDTTWTAPDVQRLMGPPEGWPASYPLTHIDGTEPPLLLLHGASDDVVTVGNSLRLAERIRARGGCVRVVTYRGVDHIEIALSLAFPGLRLGPVQRDVADFVRDPVADACPGARPPARP